MFEPYRVNFLDIRSFFSATQNAITKSEEKPKTEENEKEKKTKTKAPRQMAIEVSMAKHNPFRRMPSLTPLHDDEEEDGKFFFLLSWATDSQI